MRSIAALVLLSTASRNRRNHAVRSPPDDAPAHLAVSDSPSTAGYSSSEAADPSGVPLPAPFPRQATQLLPRWRERARKAPWTRAQVPRCSALLALLTSQGLCP